MNKKIWMLLFPFLWTTIAHAEQRWDWSRLERLVPAWPIVDVGAPIPSTLIDHWKSSAVSFRCPEMKGRYDAFPSKYNVNDEGGCDHLDTTLFVGLLCAAGVEEGCRAVREAQSPTTGMWHRSPRNRWFTDTRCQQGQAKIGDPLYCKECANTFSPDMGLGVMLYVIKTGDRKALGRWYQGMERTGQSTQLCRSDGSCQPFKWLRTCADDAVCISHHPDGTEDTPNSKRPTPINGYTAQACVLKPVVDAPDYDLMANVTRIKRGPLLEKAVVNGELLLIALSGITPAPAALPPPVRDQIFAQFSAPHFPLHLEATRVFLRMLINNPDLTIRNLPNSQQMERLAQSPLGPEGSLNPVLLHQRAQTIYQRQSWNPFYQLLAEGPSDGVRKSILSLCPQPGERLDPKRVDWLWRWETDKTDQRGVAHSMGWDCVFVGSLYNRMRVQADLGKELLALFDHYADPVAVTIGQLQASVAQLQLSLAQATQLFQSAQAADMEARRFVGASYDHLHQTQTNAVTAANDALTRANNDATAALTAVNHATPIPDCPSALDREDPVCAAARRELVARRNELNNALNSARATVNSSTKTATDAAQAMEALVARHDKAVIEVQNKVHETAARQAQADVKRIGEQLDSVQAQLAQASAVHERATGYLKVWRNK